MLATIQCIMLTGMAKAVQMLDDVPWLWLEGMSTLVEHPPYSIVETMVYGIQCFFVSQLAWIQFGITPT